MSLPPHGDRSKRHHGRTLKADEEFTALTLLDRTDADRRRVAGVVALTDFHKLTEDVRYHYGNFFRHLDKFFMLAGTNPNEFRAACDRLRDELRWAKSQNGGRFHPEYLEAYLDGLIGITYLAEEQTAAQGRHALKYLDRANTQLTNLQGRRSTAIVSALAICEALLSRDEAEDNGLALARHTFRALEWFAEARVLSAGRASDAASKYRFAVNYAECAVQAYWLYTKCAEGRDKRQFRQELSASLCRVVASEHLRDLVSRCDPTALGADRVFESLFETADRAVDKGQLAVHESGEAPDARPALHLIRFYLQLAYAVAQKNRHVPEDVIVVEASFPSPGALLEPLRTAVVGWRGGPNRLPAARVRQLVATLPGRAEWVRDFHLDDGYEQILRLLDRPAREDACAACPGHHPAAVPTLAPAPAGDRP